MLLFALRALRSMRKLRKLPLGVLLYTDEGRDARYSAGMIRSAASCASQVFVLRPGAADDKVITARRGQRLYRFRVLDNPTRPGRVSKRPEAVLWLCEKLLALGKMGSRAKRTSVSPVSLKCDRFPMLLPHQLGADLLVTYPDTAAADAIEARMRTTLGKRGPRWDLEMISDRPPMRETRKSRALYESLAKLAKQWEIPLHRETSVWPSVAGLVPAKTPCLC